MWKVAASIGAAVALLLTVWGLGVAFGEDVENVREIPEIREAVDKLVKLHEIEAEKERVRREEQAKAARQRAELCAQASAQGVHLPSCATAAPTVTAPAAPGAPQ